tara:strand:- start:511 stop:684 length:174 start_codon:yes stop_codon:yes gene_type:complete
MNRKNMQNLILNQEFDKALDLISRDISKIKCELYKVIQYQNILKKMKNKNQERNTNE